LFNIGMSEEREIQQRLDRLRAVPGRIAAATDAVSDVVLHRRTTAEPWSVNDVLAHLRAAADVRDRYMRRMATGEHATLAYNSPRSEMRKTDYVDRPFAENLAAFTAQRASLVEWLGALPADAWSHGALIRDRPETVATYAGYLAEHEAVHCDQIEALLG
jgi:uncharacterized damage-inducible protein DinB